MSINRWIHNESMSNGILFGHKNKKLLTLVTIWMDLVGVMLSEISQMEKDKYHGYHLCVEMNKSQSHRNRDQIGS